MNKERATELFNEEIKRWHETLKEYPDWTVGEEFKDALEFTVEEFEKVSIGGNRMTDQEYEDLKRRLLEDGYLIHDTRGKKKYTYFSKFQDYMRSQYTQGRNVAGYGAFMDHIKAAIKWACCAKSSEQLPDIYQEEVNKWAIEFAQRMLNIHDKEVEK